jgi:hypothetical protein
MWKYSQSSGELFNAAGTLIDTGYAGKGNAKNDPDQQCVADMGPIPRGYYNIQPAVTHPKLGPVAIPLDPDTSNTMCGRSGFFMHGDKVSDPGNASEGCVIMKRTTREGVDASDDKRLQVVRQSLLSAGLNKLRGIAPIEERRRSIQKKANRNKKNRKTVRTPRRMAAHKKTARRTKSEPARNVPHADR